MRNAVIVDVVRSATTRGKAGGSFEHLHAVDLLGQVLGGLFSRVDLDPGVVDDVIVGCVSQVADQSAGVGRFGWLAAGLPEHVPAVTIDRRCGSSQQAAHFGAQGVIAGAYDVVVAGGVESMSRVPLGSARVGKDPYGLSIAARYAPGLVSQGISAELVAARWKLAREELDEFSARSHARASAAQETGNFDREIVPIVAPAADGGTVTVSRDETIRPGTTAQRLATLPPSFRDEQLSERFPEISWSITAGNSSQLSDGASAMLIVGEDVAERENLRPRARFHSFALAGVDPLIMLTAPILATERILATSGLSLEDISVFEVNEAFASIPLAWQREFGVDEARLNPNGGAIALGHPLGGTGVKLIATLLGELERVGGRYGLLVMCEGGGMSNATLIERL